MATESPGTSEGATSRELHIGGIVQKVENNCNTPVEHKFFEENFLLVGSLRYASWERPGEGASMESFRSESLRTVSLRSENFRAGSFPCGTL